MLPKHQRLRRARDFALLSQKGRVVFGPFFTLRFRPSQEATKIGFVTSTKLFKTAVKRNRAKRRMREVLRLLRAEWPARYDLLYILKPETLTAAFGDLQASVRRSFEKMPEAMKQPPKPRPPKARRKTSVVFRHET
jgi:ribonuclease P protein component